MKVQLSSIKDSKRTLNSDGFLLLTDSPPLRDFAVGGHGLAANLVDILGADLRMLITRRARRAIKPAEIRRDFKVRLFFCPDSSPLGMRRFSPALAEIVDLIGVICSLPRLYILKRRLQPRRLLIIQGGNGWFLLSALLVAWATNVPFEIYLLDDLEHSAKLWKKSLLKRVIPHLERFMLRSATRVFAISPGYVGHVREKYAADADWLPTPMAMSAPAYRSYLRQEPDIRHLLFVGGMSDLYVSALTEIYAAIGKYNRRVTSHRLKLTLVTPAGADNLVELLPDTEDLEVLIRIPAQELDERCARSWAMLLPYSFAPEMRRMVTTSFSWKLSDAYRSGRPILVYGPAEASIPLYFKEAGLPLCATSPQELDDALPQIEALDSERLIARYAELWKRFHSPEAIRAKLGLVAGNGP